MEFLVQQVVRAQKARTHVKEPLALLRWGEKKRRPCCSRSLGSAARVIMPLLKQAEERGRREEGGGGCLHAWLGKAGQPACSQAGQVCACLPCLGR